MIPISDIIEDYVDSLPVTYYYDKIIGNGNTDPYNYIAFNDYKKDIMSQIRRNINIDLEKFLFYNETSHVISTGECVDMVLSILNSTEMNYHIEHLYTITKTSSR